MNRIASGWEAFALLAQIAEDEDHPVREAQREIVLCDPPEMGWQYADEFGHGLGEIDGGGE